MKREIIKTADGSSTIYLPEWNEHYHSKHGAIREALHVFIKSGLHHYVGLREPEHVSILEMGFGTGLNALVTFFEVKRMGITADYCGIEAYPVSSEEWKALDYPSLLQEKDASEVFQKLYEVLWEKREAISSFFALQKEKKFFSEITAEDEFDLIYFDAFGPRVQPDLWTEAIFTKMYQALKRQGVLVTYSAKGSVRRGLQAVGFEVERIPGPPGKREMLRATKPN